MRLERVDTEVLYVDEPLVRIGDEDLEWLKQKARETERGRIRICAHPDEGDPLHEMFIVHPGDAYVQPHRHRAKSESMSVLEGHCDLVFFDDKGNVTEVLEMGERGSGRLFYYRSSEERYHTLLIRSDVIVFHEITNGPFRPEDTEHAPWAPDPEDREAVRTFIAEVEQKVQTLPQDHDGTT